MRIIIILILLAFVFYFIDTYLKKIALIILFIICGCLLCKFIKWLIPQIQYHKALKVLDKIVSGLDDVESEIDSTLQKAIPETNTSLYNNIIPETNISNYDNMNGHDFEYFCADVLRKNGFVNVEVTQGSGDHGIDILAEKDEITYAIQCKCYSDNVGNAAVQQAHTGKSLYQKDIAAVMTNRHFTAQAIKEAKALGVKLWDRDKLNEMIETKQPEI